MIGLTHSLGLSIRWRLTFWNAAVMTALLTAISVVLLVSVRRHLIARADQVLMEELREFPCSSGGSIFIRCNSERHAEQPNAAVLDFFA